jgi:putative hydrolase of the HAD superfamily
MEARRITDVFFDLDHTLWDFERNSALAFEAIFRLHGVEADLQHFLAHYIPLNLKYWELYREDAISQHELRYRRLRDAFDATGYEIGDETIGILSDAYISHLPLNNHLFDGALDILDYLQEKYRLHIITNGFGHIQARKLENSNIGHYFATVTNSEKAGVKKPNPQIFQFAMRQANVQPEQCLMIGDCIDADVRGALQCGLDAILFNEKPCPVDGIKQVRSLHELKKIL